MKTTTRKTSILGKLIILFILMFGFTNSYCQKITFDTVKNYSHYTKYISLSRQMLNELKEDADAPLNKYFQYHGSNNEKYLKRNLLAVHEFLTHNVHGSLKSLIIEKSRLPLSGHVFEVTVLNITYSFGRSNCVDPTFENTVTIEFYDISKGEEKFDFMFNNCLEREKLKKAILSVPVPEN